MKRKILSTFEASQKYGYTSSHLRLLLRKGLIKGEEVKTAPERSIWLIDEASLKLYVSKELKPGPKPK